ncbi:peroxiredoxin-like family protein [uncultured Marixanthomonas sp.]|uniref:peroxiredoxin-like family protein n=1 Tax=uncultured Marixanthomonas sp. TaxID=757245 RepID=UPI0030D8326F|tara:strand:- start:90 stop:599 length:510 start_codon:yes stop_codon:yes gene_type:complete
MKKPKEKTPALKLDLINGTTWDIEKQEPENFTMMIFYRGLHCPVCKKYLEELQTKIEDFRSKGVNVVAVSMDTEKRATITTEKWDIESIPLAYGMSEEKAREWGLFISHAIKDAEPDVFSEPALFLINKDTTIYSASIQTMPFARPGFDDLLKSIDFVLKEDYPARGGK